VVDGRRDVDRRAGLHGERRRVVDHLLPLAGEDVEHLLGLGMVVPVVALAG
jgi:hypothetical protein